MGVAPGLKRYGHFKHPEDFEVVRWVVDRGSGCFWVENTPRTRVRGFKHRLVTRGPPVRVPLHRLSRVDTEWIEKAIAEDVAPGPADERVIPVGFPGLPDEGKPRP